MPTLCDNLRAFDSRVNTMSRHLPQPRVSEHSVDTTEPRTRVHFERNLATLGFFTPSSKTLRKTNQKTVAITTVIDGRRVEASATILASPKYGLPGTADQDTYLAILKLATDQRHATGLVENPIGFSSAEILRLQGKVDSGRNYAELQDQLMRMTTTTVESRGAVFLANGKRYARDAFHLLERVVLIGAQNDDGGIAEQNYIWLSQWQLQNLNANYFFPVDYDTYRQLRNPIAKALVPLLQVWLYASRAARTFEKRYDELTEILHVTKYAHVSKVREKLGPALDELVHHDYLTAWSVEPTADGRSLKLVFVHGLRFVPHRDLATTDERSVQQLDTPLLHALTSRGITERKAQELLAKRAPGQDIQRQLEWGDHQVKTGRSKFRNPPGFYVHLVETNVPVPDSFMTSAQRQARDEARHASHDQRERERRNRQAYEEYCVLAGTDYLNALPPQDREARIARAKQDIRTDHPRISPDQLDASGERVAVDLLLKQRIPVLLSFAEFCAQRPADS